MPLGLNLENIDFLRSGAGPGVISGVGPGSGVDEGFLAGVAVGEMKDGVGLPFLTSLLLFVGIGILNLTILGVRSADEVANGV